MLSTMRLLYISMLLFTTALSCTKPDMKQDIPPDTTYRLSYGDSIFYISNQPSDILVNPVNAKAGTFSVFPEGLAIDHASGVINVSQSEAGMRYRITFKAASGDSSTCAVVISGINFPDKYYRMESADTVALPVYNADPSKTLPAGSFDDDKVANNSGCAMRTASGQINLAESIRRGLFGETPKNDTRKDFEVKYRLDDRSGKAQNKIKILMYYYNRMSDVPQELQQTVQDHQAMTLRLGTASASASQAAAAARPRPPCIIVIGHNS